MFLSKVTMALGRHLPLISFSQVTVDLMNKYKIHEQHAKNTQTSAQQRLNQLYFAQPSTSAQATLAAMQTDMASKVPNSQIQALLGYGMNASLNPVNNLSFSDADMGEVFLSDDSEEEGEVKE